MRSDGSSFDASACISATSARTRSTAAGQTFMSSARARSGVPAIESAICQCACDGKPRRATRSARSFTDRMMVAFVSFASPLSPRDLKRFQTVSRWWRWRENAKNGSTLDRVLRMAHPRKPRSRATSAAADTRPAGRPARSSSCSSSVHVFSSARILARNAA